MRHYALELEEKRLNVHYVKLDDPLNTGSLTLELKRAINRLKLGSIIITETSEYRVLEIAKQWQNYFEIPVHILQDNRFLATHDDFSTWAKGKKQLCMEYCYRVMRRKYNFLIDKNGQPQGGQWNYNKENRMIFKPLLATIWRLSRCYVEKRTLSLSFFDFKLYQCWVVNAA